MKIVKEHINEAKLKDLNPKEAITKDIRELFLEDEYTINWMVSQYCQENYIECDPEDEEEMETISNSEDFKKFVEYELEYRVEEAINAIENRIIDGKITIWRIISVKPGWLQHLQQEGKRLGIYWSYEKGAAEPHWGYKGEETPYYALMQASVKEEHVNWPETVELNIRPDTGEDEKEIRLFKNTPLKLEKIWIDDVEQDISSIRDKTFKA